MDEPGVEVVEDRAELEELQVLKRATDAEPDDLVRTLLEQVCPSNDTDPSFGSSTRETTLKSVVFPAPFGPMREWMVFAPTVSESVSTAVSPPNRTVTPDTVSMGPPDVRARNPGLAPNRVTR